MVQHVNALQVLNAIILKLIHGQLLRICQLDAVERELEF